MLMNIINIIDTIMYGMHGLEELICWVHLCGRKLLSSLSTIASQAKLHEDYLGYFSLKTLLSFCMTWLTSCSVTLFGCLIDWFLFQVFILLVVIRRTFSVQPYWEVSQALMSYSSVSVLLQPQDGIIKELV